MNQSKLSDPMNRKVMALKPSQVPDWFMSSDSGESESDLVTV
jgi:hypothetical protein